MQNPEAPKQDSVLYTGGNGHGGVHVHPAPTSFIRKYIFSTDHKVIGLQYYFLALAAVFVGMFLSLLMRIHLVWPGAKVLGFDIKPETYLALLTMHGTIILTKIISEQNLSAR